MPSFFENLIGTNWLIPEYWYSDDIDNSDVDDVLYYVM